MKHEENSDKCIGYVGIEWLKVLHLHLLIRQILSSRILIISDRLNYEFYSTYCKIYTEEQLINTEGFDPEAFVSCY